MRPPVTELTNRDNVRWANQRKKSSALARIIDELTEVMRESIEAAREDMIRVLGSDETVDNIRTIKILKKELLRQGFDIAENGGYINEEHIK